MHIWLKKVNILFKKLTFVFKNLTKNKTSSSFRFQKNVTTRKNKTTHQIKMNTSLYSLILSLYSLHYIHLFEPIAYYHLFN